MRCSRIILTILFCSFLLSKSYSQIYISFGDFDEPKSNLLVSEFDSLLSMQEEIICSFLALGDKRNPLLVYNRLDGRVRIKKVKKYGFSVFLRYGFLLNGEWVEFEIVKYDVEYENDVVRVVLDENYLNPIVLRESVILNYLSDFNQTFNNQKNKMTLELHDSLSLKMFLGAINGDQNSLNNFLKLGEPIFSEFTTSSNCFCWKYYYKILNRLELV